MSTNLNLIFDEVQRILKSFSENKFLAKSSVSITSTLMSVNWVEDEIDKHYEPKIFIKNKSKLNLLRLSILSWYVDENLGFLLRTSILDCIKNKIEMSEVAMICNTRQNKDLYLWNLIQELTGNQVFGNFLDKNEWLRTISSFSVKRFRNHKLSSDSLPARRTIGVGYRDKGTLPKSDSPGKMEEFVLSSVQKEIEDSKQAAEDLPKILEGFFW